VGICLHKHLEDVVRIDTLHYSSSSHDDAHLHIVGEPDDDTRGGLRSLPSSNRQETIGPSIVSPTERLNTCESLLQARAGVTLRPNRADDGIALWPLQSLRP